MGPHRRSTHRTPPGARRKISSKRTFRAFARSRARSARRPRRWPTRWKRVTALDKTLARLATYANLQADEDTRHRRASGHAAGDDARRRDVRLGDRVCRTGDPSNRRAPSCSTSSRPSRGSRRTASTSNELFAARATHAERAGRKASRQRLAQSPARRPRHPGLLLNAEFPFPTVTLSDGRAVQLDQQTFADVAAVAESRRSRGGDVGVFRRAGRFQPDAGIDVERVRAGPASSTRRRATTNPIWPHGSTIRTFPSPVYSRLIEGVNRHLPSFHRYLKLRKRMLGVDKLHYYDLYAPLVGSVDLVLHARKRRRSISRAAVCAVGLRLRRPDQSRVHRAVDRSDAERREAIRRIRHGRRLRRASVHAHQLQRQVLRHVDGRARARPRDAQLPLEQDAAVRAGGVSHVRRGGGLAVQRRSAARLHAEAGQGQGHPHRDPRKLSGDAEGDGLQADAVRRLRAARAPNGGAGKAADRATRLRSCISRSRRSTTATIRASVSSTTTSRTSGARCRTSTAATTCSSTRRRSRPPRRCRKAC